MVFPLLVLLLALFFSKFLFDYFKHSLAVLQVFKKAYFVPTCPTFPRVIKTALGGNLEGW